MFHNKVVSMSDRTALIEHTDKDTGQIVKVSKDGKGELYLEVDFHIGIKAKLESAVEGSRLKGILKPIAKHVPRSINLINTRDVTAQKEGLRIEKLNGDFDFVDLPPQEAMRFVDVIERNTDLLDGITSK